MTIVLNHTIVPVSDKHRGAAFLADLLGLVVDPLAGPFVPVRSTRSDACHAKLISCLSRKENTRWRDH